MYLRFKSTLWNICTNKIIHIFHVCIYILGVNWLLAAFSNYWNQCFLFFYLLAALSLHSSNVLLLWHQNYENLNSHETEEAANRADRAKLPPLPFFVLSCTTICWCSHCGEKKLFKKQRPTAGQCWDFSWATVGKGGIFFTFRDQNESVWCSQSYMNSQLGCPQIFHNLS